MPKVSVIVPVYKVEKYLDRCLKSITEQTLTDIEIILVDDASPDNSGALCDKWAEKDSRIKVIHKENEGAGLSRNAGLMIATGDYVAFTDSDDYVAPDMYETLYNKAVEHNAQIAITGFYSVGGVMVASEGDIRCTECFNEDTVFEGADAINELMLNVCGALPESAKDNKYDFACWNKLFLRKVITENGLCFKSERVVLSEDVLFALDFMSHADCGIGVKGAYYYYCRNDDSVSKKYRADLFSKGCGLVETMNSVLSKRMPEKRYSIYTKRLLQAFARVGCMQEILTAEQNGISGKELKSRILEMVNTPKIRETLKTYPIWKLPKTQAVFAFAMRHRLVCVMKILVKLKRK